MLSLTTGGGAGSPDHPEGALYAEMIARAVRDIIRGAKKPVLDQVERRVPGARRRLTGAERALGWVFAEWREDYVERRCGPEPCQPDAKHPEGPCRCWRAGGMPCLRVTFSEACYGLQPPLDPSAMRERIRDYLRQNGLDLG
jgi:hypothetical protein